MQHKWEYKHNDIICMQFSSLTDLNLWLRSKKHPSRERKRQEKKDIERHIVSKETLKEDGAV